MLADNMTLLAVAVAQKPFSNQSISPAARPTAANPPQHCAVAERWDRQTPDSFVDPTLHTM